jgi:hypothetical protein
MKKFLVVLVGLMGFYMHISAQDNIKVMYYNILTYPLSPASKAVYLQTIFDYYHPDVLVCDEVESDAVASDILNNVINITSTNHYTKALYTDGPDKNNMIFFNLDKLSLKSQDTIHTDLRWMNRYRLYHNTTSTDTVFLDFYAAHLKASSGAVNELKRYYECVHFKNYIANPDNTLGQNIIFGGDFNLYSSSEDAYQLLLSPTFPLSDPIDAPGDWNANSTFAAIHTQSTHLTTSGGFIGGGLDDRFDFMLVTNDLLTPSNNAHYVTGTYKVLGNDGLHFNKNLTDLPLSTTVPDYVTSALFNMSDHLPVVMELAVNVTSTATNHLQFANVPSSGNTLINLSPFTVEVRNDLNQLVTGYNGAITLSKFQGAGNLLGTITINAVGGIATFNDVRFDQAGTYKLTCSATGLTSANSDNIAITTPVPTFTELVVPQYMGAKTASATNDARTNVSFCLKLDNLTPNTAYDLKVGLALTSEASTVSGAGNVWKPLNGFGGTSTNVIPNAFTTNSNGSSGPVWVIFQPTGNSSRFDAGMIHNIRVGYALNGATMPSPPSFVGTKTITTLDISTTARTSATTDDGAFIKGNADLLTSGMFVLLFDNETGTGDPLFSYQIRQSSATSITNNQLPSSINDVYMQSGTSTISDYPAVIPIGANNPNGVRRIESRNADNTLYGYNTDADGIWPSGANTTTISRRSVALINSTEAPLTPVILPKTLNLTVFLEGLYIGGGTMRKAQDIGGDKFAGITADQITVELHNSSSYSTIAYTANNVNLSTSGIASVNIPPVNNGSYYITIKHRNSIEITTASSISLSGSTINYNYSDAAAKVFGSNLVQMTDGKWVIYGGDVNQDGIIDSGDMSPVDSDVNSFNTGYITTDVNGDGTVDSGDFAIIDNNSTSFVSAQTP